ncbi:MAG: type II toxin-antitoxin system HicA family toxin [Cyanobacteria bacterium J06623_7]
MPKLPRVQASKAIKALERLGFTKVSQKGSHIKVRKQLENEENTKLSCVVPRHNKTLAVGTLKSILNQANVSIEEFIENL